MSLLSIPEDDIQYLYTFSQLPVNVKKDVYDALSKITYKDSVASISKKISTIHGVDESDIGNALNVYFILVKTIYKADLKEDQFVSEVVSSIVENDFDFDVDDIKTIEEVVRSFYHTPTKTAFSIVTANDLAGDNHSLYFKSRVSHNLRPVILDGKVEGLALYQSLTMNIIQPDRSHTNIHITLDSDDLDELIKTLVEAKNNLSSLKEHFGNQLIQI